MPSRCVRSAAKTPVRAPAVALFSALRVVGAISCVSITTASRLGQNSDRRQAISPGIVTMSTGVAVSRSRCAVMVLIQGRICDTTGNTPWDSAFLWTVPDQSGTVHRTFAQGSLRLWSAAARHQFQNSS